MTEDQEDLLKVFLGTDTWEVYSKAVTEMMNMYRTQADQLKVGSEDRLWLLAKAQGIEDVLQLPHTWLKTKSTK